MSLIREYPNSIKSGRGGIIAMGMVLAGLLLLLSVFSRHDATAEYAKMVMRRPPNPLPDAQPPAPSAAPSDNSINLTPVAPSGNSSPSGSVVGSSGSLDSGSMNQTPPQVDIPVNKLPLPALKNTAKVATIAPDILRKAPPASSGSTLAYFHPPAWRGQWPMFRGPGGDGVSDQSSIQPGCKILWKKEIPLPGKNSPIVWGNKIFLTGGTVEKREIYCVDAATGATIWTASPPFSSGHPNPSVSNDTGYAPATMVTDGKRVVAAFVNGDIAACDFNGKTLWTRYLGPLDNTYGPASSLALYGSGVIVPCDQGTDPAAGKSVLFALDIATGKTVWLAKRPVQASWSTPILVKSGSSEQLVACGNPWVISYNPKTGGELWRAQCLTGDVAPSAAVGAKYVYACNLGAALSAINPLSTGDITKTGVAWTYSDNIPDIASPLAIGDHLYLPATDGTLTCLDALSGKKLWEHRYDPGIKSSPIAVGRYVCVADLKGALHFLISGKSFKEVFALAAGENVEATPAAANNRIYVRGQTHLFCIGNVR